MKRIAVGLFGFFYKSGYQHWSKSYFTVNYKKSLDNYKKFVFVPYLEQGYIIDVFISTYDAGEEKNNELKQDYLPITAQFKIFDDTDTRANRQLIGKNGHVIALCDMIDAHSIQKNVEYDRIILTRFDLLFSEKLITPNLRILDDKINVTCTLEVDWSIDDNVYIFPHSLLEKFANCFKLRSNKCAHLLQKPFEEIGLNYMIDDKGKRIGEIKIFKIIREIMKKNENSN